MKDHTMNHRLNRPLEQDSKPKTRSVTGREQTPIATIDINQNIMTFDPRIRHEIFSEAHPQTVPSVVLHKKRHCSRFPELSCAIRSVEKVTPEHKISIPPIPPSLTGQTILNYNPDGHNSEGHCLRCGCPPSTPCPALGGLHPPAPTDGTGGTLNCDEFPNKLYTPPHPLPPSPPRLADPKKLRPPYRPERRPEVNAPLAPVPRSAPIHDIVFGLHPALPRVRERGTRKPEKREHRDHYIPKDPSGIFQDPPSNNKR